MSLTDDWKAKKIDTTRRYWVIEEGFSKPIPRLMNDFCEFIDSNGYPVNRKRIKAVLAPCDYEELQQLKEEKDKWAYQCGKSDVEKWEYQRGNTHLRNLLKECRTLCKEMMEISRLYKQGETICPCRESITELLTRINAAIDESERKF